MTLFTYSSFLFPFPVPFTFCPVDLYYSVLFFSGWRRAKRRFWTLDVDHDPSRSWAKRLTNLKLVLETMRGRFELRRVPLVPRNNCLLVPLCPRRVVVKVMGQKSSSDRNDASSSDRNDVSSSDRNDASSSDRNDISSSDRNDVSSSDRDDASSSCRNDAFPKNRTLCLLGFLCLLKLFNLRNAKHLLKFFRIINLDGLKLQKLF